ncbi:armadillo-type protein [Scheffersomyces xylosifermentans]|uniref:armadillo-type protein n=1 Tax=Scheffersomyces xylosifermentans TaxID=1304137 RepID=UPI00315CE4C5
MSLAAFVTFLTRARLNTTTILFCSRYNDIFLSTIFPLVTSRPLNLIIQQNSPDNAIRIAAEREFNQAVSQDPSQAAYVLIDSALNNDLPVDLRQSCLLHLKRLVPLYWSFGFQSFVGPPVNQELKEAIRQNLIDLATSSPESKLRSGSAYVIVQIASSDYPDEWPQLLNKLYTAARSQNNEIATIGGLTVLNDLFDDLINEEQFWEGGVGAEITTHLISLLNNDKLSAETKTIAMKLYQSVISTLESPEAYSTEERKQYALHHISSNIPVFVEFLQKSINTKKSTEEIFLNELNYRSYIYKVLTSFIGNFNKKILPEIKRNVLSIALEDLGFLSHVYKQLLVEDNKSIKVHTTQDLDEPPRVFNNLISDLLSTISSIQHSLSIKSISPLLPQVFVSNLISASMIPKETIEEYEADINTYVTDITSLSSAVSVRDSMNELLSEINSEDAKEIFKEIFQFIARREPAQDWRITEAYLFIAESLFSNEDAQLVDQSTSLTGLLSSIASNISYENFLVTSRCFLLLPKFFEKFEDTLSTKTFGIKAFTDMIIFTSQLNANDSANFIKFSALISCTYYQHLFKVAEDLDKEKRKDVQLNIFKLAYSLIEESEEDGLPPLLEAITFAIDIDPLQASAMYIGDGVNVIDIIFRITFKDPANIQLIVNSTESLSSLLNNITIQDYVVSCEKSLPFIFNIMNAEISKGTVEYNPELYLSLELLSIIIGSVPESEVGLPSQIFSYAFPALKKLILLTGDNQILQSAGEVFNNLLKRASKLFLDYADPESKESGVDSLLTIIYKFLSPELSDSAANNCGTIILSFITQFQSYLSSDFMSQILEATVKRLLIASEAVTIENLIMVFCQLVLNSPAEMINFLDGNIHLPDPKTGVQKSGLELILPIWFESFEVTRGYEKIKQNALALGKIFSLGDERIENMIVNGDIIPYQGDLIITRSMAKAMPDQFTQVPASLKILKLLVGELDFQCQQPNADDYLPDVVEGEGDATGDEGWEDMDDIGVPNFEKLKSYVDSDNDDEDYEDQKGDEGLKNILVQFFKECTAKNLGHFQKYYEMLSDDEKKIISENVIF